LSRKVGEIDRSTLNSYVSPQVRERSAGTPTPERRAKEPDGFEPTLVTSGNVYREPEISHKTREPVHVYREHITEEEEAAALMFLKDCNIRFSQSITPRYDGMPRGNAGPRHGGVPDHYREAHERLEFVLGRITQGDRSVLVPLVVGVRNEQTGQRTQIQDVARDRGVAYRDKADLSKVGLGLLKAALDHVHKAYRDYQLRTRKTANNRALTSRRSGSND